MTNVLRKNISLMWYLFFLVVGLYKSVQADSFVPIAGVDSYDIDLKEQKVTITGNVKPDDVLDRISRTGKATTFWHGE